MNLGLGLIAADSYYKEGDARKERDYVQAKRDAELSTLGDKTAADRSGYQLRSAQNQQGLDLLPGDTDIKKTTQRTAGINANIGLANAENDQANLPSSLQVKNNTLQGQLMTSNAALAELPGKLQRAAVQGVLDQNGQRDVVLGTMGQLIARQDKAAAVNFANEIAKQGDVMPNSNGKTFTDIQPVKGGPQGDGYNFVTSDGESRFVPVQAISAAMNKLKSSEYQFIHTNDGSVYSGNKQTGAVNQVHQGNPKINSFGDRRPREIQLFEFYKGLGYGQDDALAKVKELGHKSRQQFEADALKDAFTTAMGRTPEEKAANAYAMVKRAADLVYGAQQGQAPASAQTGAPVQQPSTGLGAANPAPSNSIDPQIRNLLGIPAQ